MEEKWENNLKNGLVGQYAEFKMDSTQGESEDWKTINAELSFDDLIKYGDVTNTVVERIKLRDFFKKTIQTEREKARAWEEEALRYCKNADYWEERFKKARAEGFKEAAE
jgi:hypothetical protein